MLESFDLVSGLCLDCGTLSWDFVLGFWGFEVLRF